VDRKREYIFITGSSPKVLIIEKRSEGLEMRSWFQPFHFIQLGGRCSVNPWGEYAEGCESGSWPKKEVVMGILSWLVMGLLVGALAKFIMPGDDPGGFFVTIGIGIAGAFIGGAIGSFLGIGEFTGFNLGSIVIAVGGALLLLFGYRRFKK
jgi:uncharacterized membrane protein YeaQ/YmgE (transglycosylase-associated protein family)